jgi:hypothetical protein
MHIEVYIFLPLPRLARKAEAPEPEALVAKPAQNNLNTSGTLFVFGPWSASRCWYAMHA